MNRTLPEIAVLMPAYNAEKFIMRAIESLNDNTVAHDIIIMDDGSNTPISEALPRQDNIIVLRSDKNEGVGCARNRGLRYAVEQEYKYVAWLDADDMAVSQRLERQKEFLEQNPDIGMVGSWARIVNEEGIPQYYLNMPTSHDEIAIELFYHSCMFNPSLMFRCEIVKQGVYCDPSYTSGGDWDYIRKFAKTTKIANIPEYLVDYTIMMSGITQSKPASHMLKRDLRIQLSHANYLSSHFYLGIIKTALNTVRTLLKARKKHNIKEDCVLKAETLPVYVRSPFRGIIQVGERAID